MKILTTLSLIIIFVLCTNSICYCQCPENPDELIINTQEKHDHFFKKYPDCREYHIIMVNGKFVGDPKPVNYLITLAALLGIILWTLRIIIVKLKLE